MRARARQSTLTALPSRLQKESLQPWRLKESRNEASHLFASTGPKRVRHAGHIQEEGEDTSTLAKAVDDTGRVPEVCSTIRHREGVARGCEAIARTAQEPTSRSTSTRPSRGTKPQFLHAQGRLSRPGTDLDAETVGKRSSECPTYTAKLANAVMILAGKYMALASVIVVVQAVISWTSFYGLEDKVRWAPC